MGRLTDRTVHSAKPGRHGDGRGLFILVSPTGRKKWVLRYQMRGVRRDMGLGPYPEVTLAAARDDALDARRLVRKGIDPIDKRKADTEAQRRVAKPVPTFGDIAKQVIAKAQAETSNAKVAYQWERHLGPVYSGPLLDRPVNAITTLDVEAVLEPVWRDKPEVARKLLPAIRRVFEHARVQLKADHGIVMAENVADWRELKARGFKKPKELSRGRHPSLPYAQMPAFMAALRERDATAARALEFLILTNVRTDAVLKSGWDQFDLDAAVWIVPLVNLKDREHRTEGFRVPLSPRAVEIVRQMQGARTGRMVFPGQGGDAPLSNMAMLVLLKRMNSGDEKWLDPESGRPITAHGFRSSFRTWAAEASTFPPAIVEEAMGHQVGNKVERAYQRSDVLEQRRKLMSAWARHCEPLTPSNVVRLAR